MKKIISIIFILAASVCFVENARAIPSNEEQALINLYDLTGGNDWKNDTGWATLSSSLSGVNSDQGDLVHGVHIDSGRVVQLQLDDNNLTGTMTDAISAILDLSNLEYLDFSSNNFTGSIPSSIGQFSNLHTLFLYGNELSGDIPVEIWNLFQLEYLNLSQDIDYENGDAVIYRDTNADGEDETITNPPYGLTGTISRIANLANLTYVDLSGNKLTGSIPGQIGRLTRLVEFDVSKNRLSGPIPVEFGSLGNLEYLSLYNNLFAGGIPNEIGNLVRLSTLYLCCNELDGNLPPELGNLILLEKLHAYGNRLTGQIPSSFGGLSGLIELQLNDNQLSGDIPPEIGNLENLEILYMPNNGLTGIPSEIGNLTKLTDLTLHDNALTGIIPPSIGNLTNLNALYLDTNQLTGDIPRDIMNLQNLGEFNLCDNNLNVPTDSDLIAFLNSTHSTDCNWQDQGGVTPPAILYTGRIVNEYQSNGQVVAYASICGSLPDPVASASVTGPSFSISDMDPEGNCLRGQTQSTAQSGTYEFYLNGQKVADYDFSSETIPVINILSPKDMNAFPADSITLEWGEVGAYAYSVQMADENDIVVYESNGVSTGHEVPAGTLNSEETFRWRVYAWSGSTWDSSENRSVSDWVSFTTEAGTSQAIPVDPVISGPLVSGETVTITATNFPGTGYDTHWQVRRIDRGYNCDGCDGEKPNPSEISIGDSGTVDIDISNYMTGLRYAVSAIFSTNGGVYSSNWSEEQTFVVGNSVNDPLGTMPGSTERKDFKMISPGVWPNYPQANDVFGTAISDYENNFRIGSYDPLEETYDQFESDDFVVQPGRACWFLSRNDYTVSFTGVQVTTDADIEVWLEYNTITGNGWNMIACPNQMNYDWEKIVVVDYGEDSDHEKLVSEYKIGDQIQDNTTASEALISGNLYWSPVGEGYVSYGSGTLEYHKGYWVKALKPNLALRFVRDAQSATVRKSKRAAYSGDSPPEPPGFNSDSVKDSVGGCFIESASR